MNSLKARLLMVLTVAAMLVAVSVPAMADDGCIGVGDGSDCTGVFTGDSFDDSCFDSFGNNICDDFGDECFDSFGNFDSNCDNFDTFDQGFDTISVGDLECLTEDGDVDFCVDENGDVVNV